MIHKIGVQSVGTPFYSRGIFDKIGVRNLCGLSRQSMSYPPHPSTNPPITGYDLKNGCTLTPVILDFVLRERLEEALGQTLIQIQFDPLGL